MSSRLNKPIQVEVLASERIIVKFDYRDMGTVKDALGGRFVGAGKGGPGLVYVLSMETCKKIREKFPEADFSEELLEWGKAERGRRINLVDLANSEDTDLAVIQQRIPEMHEKLRNYQRVGVKFIAEAPHPLVADQPGLGKTWESIGGVFEAGLADGPNLVVCPKIAIETVWLEALNRFQDNPVFVAPEGAVQRARMLAEVEDCLEMEQPFWLVVNPAMLTFRKTKQGDPRGVYDGLTGEYFQTQFPFLMRTQWNAIIVDEAHKTGLSNPSSQTARALHKVLGRKRIAMSGTPAGGKAKRLWGLLHWLEPEVFRSRRQWEEKWLEIEEGFNRKTGQKFKTIKGIKPWLEEDFWREHAHYILRRKKSDVAKDLPPKNHIPIWVNMLPEQAKQYALMEDEAEMRLMEDEQEVGRVVSSNVLTTYAWLKQFSWGVCEVYEKGLKYDEALEENIMKYGVKAVLPSPKMDALLDILTDLGMPEDDGKCVVFTQFLHVAELVTEELVRLGYRAKQITGKTAKRDYRAAVQEDFQTGNLQVLVMTTTAGGVAITLDASDTVVFLDETWDPDDQEQAEDRCHRISRMHQVNVYTIRTRGSVDVDVFDSLENKRNINDILLDRYRQAKEGDEGWE